MANLEQLVEDLSSLSVMEAAELAGMLEEKWGVSAAAVAAPAAAAGAAGGEAAPAEEQTEFDVVLTNHGDKKINVIKEVRALTGLALGEAKSLVESGGEVLKGVDKSKADEAKSKLEAAGATVEVK